MKLSNKKIIAIALATLFSCNVVVAADSATTPQNFALPFGIEGLQNINSKAIPNLVFLIDNSKRTGELLPSGETKLDSYIGAVKQFISSHQGQYRFGIATLYDIDNDPASVANVMLVQPEDGNGAAVLAALNSITVQPYEHAPIITSLTQVYKDVAKSAIIYRCQQSHVFVVSDGDSTGDADKARLSFPHGDDVIYPETAAYTKMVGTFDPYKPVVAKNAVDYSYAWPQFGYNVGEVMPKTWPSVSGRVSPCGLGNLSGVLYQTFYSADQCFIQPSPDGYSTYAHFDDQDTYWNNKAISHKFDDPEYPVQSIYTSWFSSSDTKIDANTVLKNNAYRSELLVSPKTMAVRGKGYYRDISSQAQLASSISEVAGKIKSNPAYAMGRYYENILIAGYPKPVKSYNINKGEDDIIYLDYGQNSDAEKLIKNIPILRVANYPNKWASTFVLSVFDEKGSLKKYPDIINPNFKHNESFAGRPIEMQIPSFAMVNRSATPTIVNTQKGIKLIADGQNGTRQFGYEDISSLSNEDFGFSSTDAGYLKRVWPTLFTLGDNVHVPQAPNSKHLMFRRDHIRPNTLTSYSSIGGTLNSNTSIYKAITGFDESYEPTTGAMDSGVMFGNQFLAMGNKYRYRLFYYQNDISSEYGGGTVGMSIGVTAAALGTGYIQAQWTDKHYPVIGGADKTSTDPIRPYFQGDMIVGSNNGQVIVFGDAGGWGLGAQFVYVPGATQREQNETILQALGKSKHINYGDEDHPFNYVLNGQFAAIETKSYNDRKEISPGYFRDNEKYQIIAVGTTGQGGKGVYSLNGSGYLARTGYEQYAATGNDNYSFNAEYGNDPAKRDTLIKSSVNWDSAMNPHTGAPMVGLEKIGYTIGKPILGQMAMTRKNGLPNVEKDVRVLAFVANGYNGTESKPSLYVIDALGADVGTAHEKPVSTNEMGKLLRKIEMPVPDSNNKNNALTGISLVDLDFNGVYDLGYAADYNGNVYRIDFRGNTIDDWQTTLIYEGNPSQPITTAPTVSLNKDQSVTVVFGTGSQIYKKDATDKSVQALYGIIDRYSSSMAMEVPSYLTRKDVLVEQTLSEAKDISGQTVRIATTNKPNDKQNRGWFIDLQSQGKSALGERVLVEPTISDGSLFLTTYFIKPEYLNGSSNGAVCSVPMGYSGTWQMILDASTGGNITVKNSNIGKTQLSSGGSIFTAGTQYTDRVAPFYLITSNNLPYNANGQASQSGKLFTPGKVIKPKECDGTDILVYIDPTSQDRNTVVGTTVTCADTPKGTARRVAWRLLS
ncbi:PilC/PilY family type IV pilus protein [Neisseria sp. Ec49-e6-T10]|uniref:PilC/PilY family type IV pilus protein n=1 Tax=Neisseria sp. Ec49-e6-T10 TaxID=3140744 RepID=UPI003EB6B84B